MAASPKQTTDQGQDIMAELDAGDAFDEGSIPIERRLAIVRGQLAEWQEVAYSSKIAYGINKSLGSTPEELAPIIQQFTRARTAATELTARIAELEQELARRGPPHRPGLTA